MRLTTLIIGRVRNPKHPTPGGGLSLGALLWGLCRHHGCLAWVHTVQNAVGGSDPQEVSVSRALPLEDVS